MLIAIFTLLAICIASNIALWVKYKEILELAEVLCDVVDKTIELEKE